jgi:hypothetical protein
VFADRRLRRRSVVLQVGAHVHRHAENSAEHERVERDELLYTTTNVCRARGRERTSVPMNWRGGDTSLPL